MRILVLSPHRFYIDRGTPIDSDLVLRALSERGETVDVVTYPDGEDRDYPGVTLHRIARRRWLCGTRPGFSLKKVACDALLFAEAIKLLRRNRYDLVHAGEETAYLAMLFRRLFGVPYVYDMDSSVAQQMVEQMPWLRPLSGLFNWLERRAIRRSLAVAPVCNDLADLAIAAGAPHCAILHDISQLDIDDLRTDGALRRELGIERPIAMYAGNLEPYQGVDLLLDGFERALDRGADLDLVIAGGTGARIREYEARAVALGIADRTHFIGPWPADRLGALLMEAEILVAPRTRGINTPMKIFPYLHTGRAVLVTNLPTHTQILDDEVAMMAEPTADAFGEALMRLATDEPLRQRLGSAGRAFVEANHTWAAHRGRVDELYDHLTSVLAPAGVQPPLASSRVPAPSLPSSVAGASTASTRSSRVSRMS